MLQVTVNSKVVSVPKGCTVMKACEIAGEKIPHFCYHDKLKIAGNCRMCMVEVQPGPPKPAASCAMPVSEGMKIFTNSPMAIAAQQSAIEFILLNHPLDCPICDRAGECELQDQAFAYGSGHRRCFEPKRAVPVEHFSPMIKGIMTRCIHCARCTRFMNDIAGDYSIGIFDRGNNAFIGKTQDCVDSKVSGNIIDLCPVGALTSEAYSFLSRPWELTSVDSVDVHDALLSSIRLDSRDGILLRVLPKYDDTVNEIYISDKCRFAYDGLFSNRLTVPHIKRQGVFDKINYDTAIKEIASKISTVSSEEIGCIVGGGVDCETIFSAKLLFGKLLECNNIDFRQRIDFFPCDDEYFYGFHSEIAEIENADLVLLLNVDPDTDSPVFNLRIRKAYLDSFAEILYIGAKRDIFGYPVTNIGHTYSSLTDAILNEDSELAKKIKRSKNPYVVVGEDFFDLPTSGEILKAFAKKYDLFDKVNILFRKPSTMGALKLGFYPKDSISVLEKVKNGEIKILYLIGADEIDFSVIPDDVIIIYQGSHMDAGFSNSYISIPSVAHYEKDGTYIGINSKMRFANKAHRISEIAKNIETDTDVLLKIPHALGRNDFAVDSLHIRFLLYEAYPFMKDEVVSLKENIILEENRLESCSMDENIQNFSKFSDIEFSSKDCDFYVSDSVARASMNMRNLLKAYEQSRV